MHRETHYSGVCTLRSLPYVTSELEYIGTKHKDIIRDNIESDLGS